MICSHDPTFEELVEAYLIDRERYYDSGAGPGREAKNVASGLRPFVDAFGHLHATAITAAAVQAEIDAWCATGEYTAAWLNKRLQYFRRFIKWCVPRGFVTGAQAYELDTVEGAKPGRAGARPSSGRQPVDQSVVWATLPRIASPAVRDMLKVMWYTGMRTGEARVMHTDNLSPVVHRGRRGLLFTLEEHKTKGHGHTYERGIFGEELRIIERRIAEIPDGAGYVFSVRGDGAEPYAECSVGQAVRNALEGSGIEPWTPHQIRHRFITEVVDAEENLYIAAVLANHASVKTTERYAKRKTEKKLDAALRHADRLGSN